MTMSPSTPFPPPQPHSRRRPELVSARLVGDAAVHRGFLPCHGRQHQEIRARDSRARPPVVCAPGNYRAVSALLRARRARGRVRNASFARRWGRLVRGGRDGRKLITAAWTQAATCAGVSGELRRWLDSGRFRTRALLADSKCIKIDFSRGPSSRRFDAPPGSRHDAADVAPKKPRAVAASLISARRRHRRRRRRRPARRRPGPPRAAHLRSSE